MVDDLTEGDTIQASGPQNDFKLAPAPAYILIAGGIGITPIMAIARQLLRTHTPFKLIHCTRTAETTAFASLTYSGYAHFDGDELCEEYGELGRKNDPTAYGAARRALADAKGPNTESDRKRARNYGLAGKANDFTAGQPFDSHEHFGLVIASCQRADLRLRPDGVMIYGDDERRHAALPAPEVPRIEVMDELYEAVVRDRPSLHSTAWGLATLEVCIAMLTSAREGREVELEHQVGLAATELFGCG